MAFSLRKMLSNITYFTKPEDENASDDRKPNETSNIEFNRTEPDSTSKYATSLKLPNSIKNYAAKKGSLSDTDIYNVKLETPEKKIKKCKKLKVDINKTIESDSSNSNIENTPKHIHLECNSAEIFSQRFRGFDFDKSFDLFDAMSDEDRESISGQSDSDISLISDTSEIKMCRKVLNNEVKMCHKIQEPIQGPSATPESFGDLELERNEEERVSLLLNYQLKLEKYECFLKKLLSDFQFHIEFSKVFLCKSIIVTENVIPKTESNQETEFIKDISKIEQNNLEIELIKPNKIDTEWNIIVEKDDIQTKEKIKAQLSSMKDTIQNFIKEYLVPEKSKIICQRKEQKKRISIKKKQKHYDFPDLREAFLNLFSDEDIVTDDEKCSCQCHTETDSGLSNKDQSITSQSITSSIGNFTLDTSTLTAYSESLDQIISYNSFQDSLYSTILQKVAIERITFYVQVHSIQLNSDDTRTIIFFCPACKITENEESGLLKHILSQYHCEKIHFLYKTAYIKKCMSLNKEIMPSTVLNPMKLYRDDNKIVCFGDAMYACSLCFENLIIGESILMAHIAETEHVERRDKLSELE